MARGPSGRIVIEVEPTLKRDLHSALVADGISLKDWFLRNAREYMADRGQPRLPGMPKYPAHAEETMLAAEEALPYKTPAETKP